jgi:dCTP deaminase
MVLSNKEIVAGIKRGSFSISPLNLHDPASAPFNTSAVDLTLDSEIVVPDFGNVPIQLDLRKPGIAKPLSQNSKQVQITNDQGYALKNGMLVLGKTAEVVDFPLVGKDGCCYSARVEGRSSIARCGILVHFTAPTIHAGFQGTITLEIINWGPAEFLLYPGLRICQLIIEEVKGIPTDAPNQFKGQHNVVGLTDSVVQKKSRK